MGHPGSGGSAWESGFLRFAAEWKCKSTEWKCKGGWSVSIPTHAHEAAHGWAPGRWRQCMGKRIPSLRCGMEMQKYGMEMRNGGWSVSIPTHAHEAAHGWGTRGVGQCMGKQIPPLRCGMEMRKYGMEMQLPGLPQGKKKGTGCGACAPGG